MKLVSTDKITHWREKGRLWASPSAMLVLLRICNTLKATEHLSLTRLMVMLALYDSKHPTNDVLDICDLYAINRAEGKYLVEYGYIIQVERGGHQLSQRGKSIIEMLIVNLA